LLELRIDAAFGVAPDGGLPNLAGQGLYNVLGREDWEWLRAETLARMRVVLPSAVAAVYAMSDEALDLKATMVEKMSQLSSAEFERVLHPVFEEEYRTEPLEPSTPFAPCASSEWHAVIEPRAFGQ
jgi:hypothetical protein